MVVAEGASSWRNSRSQMKNFFLYKALLAALILTGCATTRSAREAQDLRRVPAGERTANAAEMGLVSNAPLSLDRAIRLALRYHPSIVLAQQDLVSARAGWDSARAGAKPSLGASAGYKRSTSNNDKERDDWSSDGSYSAGLNADLLLYDFGKTPSLIAAAAARVQAAEQSLVAAHNEVTFNVRSAYYTLAQNRALLEVAHETVRQFEVRLTQTTALKEVGKRIKYDITKAQVDLGNATLAKINAAASVTTARASLNNALGLAEEPGYSIEEPGVPEFTEDLPALLALARGNQPELRALQFQVTAASNAVNAAIADLYPSFSLSGAFSFAGDAFPLFWNWSAGANAAASLFDGGSRNAKIMQAVTDLRSARARQADREQQIFADLSQSLAKLDAAKQRLKLSELIVQQARESLILVSERYRIGSASAVEQTDAQAALATAQAEAVRARFDVLNNIAAIQRTTG